MVDDSAPRGASVTPSTASPSSSPSSSSDSTPPQNKNVDDEADKARAYLRAVVTGEDLNLTEESRDFIVPLSSFVTLCDEPEFESDRKRRKVSYDAHRSILTIFPMTTRHGYIRSWLQLVGNTARMTIPLPLGTSRPIFLSQDDFYEFEGLWEGSLKQPDFAVLWKHGRNEFIINTIVEVGCSQTRESLLACRDTYLEGVPSLSRFISLNVIENPRYAAPKKIELDIAKLKNIDNSTIQVDSIEGPIRYEGIQWVGKNTFSWEVWERNAIDGKPQRVFAAAFDPDDNEGRQLPFFEIPTTIAADIEGITITPADLQLFWEDFLDSAVVREAKRRMINYMRHEMKRRKNEEDTLKAKNDAATKKQIANMERSERHRCRSEREH